MGVIRHILTNMIPGGTHTKPTIIGTENQAIGDCENIVRVGERILSMKKESLGAGKGVSSGVVSLGDSLWYSVNPSNNIVYGDPEGGYQGAGAMTNELITGAYVMGFMYNKNIHLLYGSSQVSATVLKYVKNLKTGAVTTAIDAPNGLGKACIYHQGRIIVNIVTGTGKSQIWFSKVDTFDNWDATGVITASTAFYVEVPYTVIKFVSIEGSIYALTSGNEVYKLSSQYGLFSGLTGGFVSQYLYSMRGNRITHHGVGSTMAVTTLAAGQLNIYKIATGEEIDFSVMSGESARFYGDILVSTDSQGTVRGFRVYSKDLRSCTKISTTQTRALLIMKEFSWYLVPTSETTSSTEEYSCNTAGYIYGTQWNIILGPFTSPNGKKHRPTKITAQFTIVQGKGPIGATITVGASSSIVSGDVDNNTVYTQAVLEVEQNTITANLDTNMAYTSAIKITGTLDIADIPLIFIDFEVED